MKIIDKDGRLFGKISIIDVLVILVVIVLAISQVFKKNQTHTGTVINNEPITFQLLITGERQYVTDAIREKDELYDLDNRSNGPLGTIQRVEILPGPGLKEAALYDGTDEMVPMEDSVCVRLTVKGSGIISDNRYLLNRVYNLGVNTVRNYYTPYAQFTATVSAILE